MTAGPNLHETGERVEALLQRFDASLSPFDARSAAEELVRSLTELYGAGLERTLEIVHETGEAGSARIFDRLAADKLVASLLILHGLHPQSVEERVAAALDGVRPYLNSHEGDIEILRIADGVVHLRLAGSCHGCPSSLATVKLTVERAILEAAPEIAEVRAHGVSSSEGAERRESEWIELAAHDGLRKGGTSALEVDGMPVLLASDGRLVHAVRNQCSRCLRSLATATLDWPLLGCRSCDQQYDLAKGGRAPNDALALEIFAVTLDVRDAQRIRVAVPVTA